MGQILTARSCNGPDQGAITAAPEPPMRLRDLAPAAVFGAAGLVALIIATLLGAGNSGQMLVFGPPALDRDRVTGIVWQAGGTVIDFGGLPNVAIATAMTERPDFAEALKAAGAWLVLPSPRLLGCFAETGADAE